MLALVLGPCVLFAESEVSLHAHSTIADSTRMLIRVQPRNGECHNGLGHQIPSKSAVNSWSACDVCSTQYDIDLLLAVILNTSRGKCGTLLGSTWRDSSRIGV